MAAIPATVPGTVALALLRAGLDPSGPSLDERDWWFRCRFRMPPATSPVSETVLRLDGLATIADVWLNGNIIATSENMFLPLLIPVSDLLLADNKLALCFRALAPLLQQKRPRPRWRTRIVTQSGLRWFRTTVAGRAPGFAPGPAVVGPWRSVTIERRQRVVIDALTLRPELDPGDEAGTLTLGAIVRAIDLNPLKGARIEARGPGGTHAQDLEVITAAEVDRVEGVLRIPDVAAWWPHTHGEPTLYEVRLVLERGDGEIEADLGPIGFRRVEAAPLATFGLTVNGVSVFCRGGALMPDAYTADHDPVALRSLLESACAAGMNMIRLPGIGAYGSKALFELCDALGLLVWQDFPFANMDYPMTDPGFKDTVAKEVDSFLWEVGRHPSLAVLCGGSEVEQQATMLGFEPEIARSAFFDAALPAAITAAGISVPYVSSSPTGGDLPFRVDEGIAHYFGVGGYRRPLEDARRAGVRFAAECLAFAHVPDDEMLDGLAANRAGRHPHHPSWKEGVPRDNGADWDFDDVRDHYLRVVFGLDPDTLREIDPERYIAVSRLVTGEVMANVLGEWRRERSTCAGALLWTLNDVLPGAGWGVLDSNHRPKAAYWYVRRALAPVAVWFTDEGTNGLAVHLANDTADPIEGSLSVAALRRDGHCTAEGVVPVSLPPRSTSEYAAEAIIGRFVDIGYAYRFGPPEHDLVVAELTQNSGVLRRAVHFPTGPPPDVDRSSDIRLHAAAQTRADGSLEVEVSTGRLAYGVAVNAPGFDLSDDVFTVPPGRVQHLVLSPRTASAVATDVRLCPLNASDSTALDLR
ncbi:MAG: glycoside hydrolase family 2 protein [Thermoleophilia bacterium]